MRLATSVSRRPSLFRPLCAAYILTLPVVHAFAPNLWIPLPMGVLLVFLPLYAVHVARVGKLPRPATTPFDHLLVLLVAVIYLSTLLHPGNLGDKQFNHLLSYLAVVGLYYFGAKYLLQASRITHDEVMGWLTVTVLITAGFGLVEFAGKNLLGFDVDAFVPRPEGVRYISTFAGVVVRSRSFMSESANFASFLDMLAPILIIHWWENGKRARSMLILGIVILALFTTFSAAATVAVCGGALAVVLLHVPRVLLSGRGLRAFLPLGVFAGLVAAGFGMLISNRDARWATSIIDKLLLVDPSSAGDRLQRWTGALEMISRNPLIGSGAGSFLHASQVGQGIVSWPLQVVTEGGFVAGALLALLLLLLLWRAVRISGGRRYGYVMAVVAFAVHYSVISDYWMPWIWFLILLLYRAPVRHGAHWVPVPCPPETAATRPDGALA